MNTQAGVNPAVLPQLTLAFRTVKELYAMPEEKTSFCVEKFLPSGGFSVLAGKPKAGKSTLSRQLAVAVAQGGCFMGRMAEKGRVLYIGLEEKIHEVKNHFLMLGLKEEDNLLIHCGRAGKNAVGELEALLKEDPTIRLVVIDPLFKFARVKDADDYIDVNDAMEILLDLARKHGTHILTVHHCKKKLTEDWVDQILGSSAINGGVDTIIGLFIVKGSRVLASRQRYGKDFEETVLTFDHATKSMSLGQPLEEFEQTEANENSERILADILKYVSSNPDCIQPAIINSVTGKGATKKQLLRKAVDEGMLTVLGDGVKGEPHTYRSAAIAIEDDAERAVAA